MSRTIQGRRMLGRVEKEMLRKMIWQLADFSGLRVITYCVMSNHFHLLIEVPEKQEVDDQELVRRFRVLYPKPTKEVGMRGEDLARLLSADEERGQEMREWLLGRMGDLSIFMKALKQRYSVWYNQTHETFGAFWAERFKSVLVEGTGFVLQAVAAYIDLNPVRAGLVKDPKDYRFSGYGEAVVGREPAVAGVRRVMRCFGDEAAGADPLAGYRELLFATGSRERIGAGSISREVADRVIQQEGGNLGLGSVWRCRFRFFSEGMILGSEPFLREMLKVAEWGQTKSGRQRVLKAIASDGLEGLCLLGRAGGEGRRIG